MFTLVHTVINTFVGIVVGFSPVQLFMFALGGTLIDLDHLFYVLFAKKMYSPKAIYEYFFTKKGLLYKRLFLFHTVEFQVLALLISYFFSQLAFFFFAGFVLHLLYDIAWHWWKYRDFALRDRYFFLNSYFKNKKNIY